MGNKRQALADTVFGIGEQLDKAADQAADLNYNAVCGGLRFAAVGLRRLYDVLAGEAPENEL